MQSLRVFAASLAVLVTGVLVASAQVSYPVASPRDVGISAEALELLSDHVDRLVKEEAVVGAELHIIQDRKTVLHQAYGWADREEQRALQVGTTYCVRSMTKPLCGTAIQMLIDERKLSLDDRVAELIPEFDTPELQGVTIEHLLTHTSGLPLTAIRRPLLEYESLRDVAVEAAEAGVSFEPGAKFQYSDAGSDTLGAIIENVTGQAAGDFVRERILEPTGMGTAVTLLEDVEPRPFIPSAYSGNAGNWRRHWKSSDPPFFSIFLTSQSLYCTTTDYARFLALWMDGGAVDQQRLISEEAVGRGLKPVSPMQGYPAGFGKLNVSYGQQWMVYHEEGSASPVVFGHNGSDGTYAWAWPERDLIVLFFTQSRGSDAGVGLESVLQQLLVKPDIQGYQRDLAAEAVTNQNLDAYSGIYWDEDVEDAYYYMSNEKGKLILERPGQGRIIAKPTKKLGHFKIGSSTKIEFERGKEVSPAMLMTWGARTERQIRHQPDAGLPSIDEVMARAAAAHHWDALEDGMVIVQRGKMRMGVFGTDGEITQWSDRHNSRTEIKFGATTMLLITNGKEAGATGIGGAFSRLEGVSAQQELLGHGAIEYGGWKRGYDELSVLKSIKNGKELLVRAVAPELPGTTLFVDHESGRVTGSHRIQFIPGMGFVGLASRYSDFRKVGGVLLPFKIDAKYSSKLLGKTNFTFEEGTTEPAQADLFKFPDSSAKQPGS